MRLTTLGPEMEIAGGLGEEEAGLAGLWEGPPGRLDVHAASNIAMPAERSGALTRVPFVCLGYVGNQARGFPKGIHLGACRTGSLQSFPWAS
jgi:hypothetical protein